MNELSIFLNPVCLGCGRPVVVSTTIVRKARDDYIELTVTPCETCLDTARFKALDEAGCTPDNEEAIPSDHS